MMKRPPFPICIPDDIEFADLKLARDPATGVIKFDWTPIERICAASGIDASVFRDHHEDNLAALILQWYASHLAAGGTRDPVQDELVVEMLAEDALGGGYSHPTGHA